MVRLLKEDLRVSTILNKRLAVEGRGLEDLVFRVGLATRNNYMVSHKERRILRWEGDSPSSYSYEGVTGLKRGKCYDPDLRAAKAKTYEEGLPNHVT